MESDRTDNNNPSDAARNGLQGARPLHGRTSGPTRRSTKGQWTAEEDETLRMAVQRFKGKNWKKIAECFRDRTDVQCLHRWQKVLNPDLVKGPWSKEEDHVIIEMVKKYGPKKWSSIANHLPGRIGKQCRERWHNHLNPNINREAWTQDEELTLIRAHQIYGNKWAELTKFLPGRTDNSIKNHWHSSVKKKVDIYLTTGLLAQFQGVPLVSHPNQSEASSCSKAQQSSEDNSDVKGGIEAEEASECSQGSNVANMSQPTSNTIAHPVGDCRITEESCSIQYSEDYDPAFLDAVFGEAPCELSDNFLEHDFPLDWEALTGDDWQLNPNELPDLSLLDLGEEPPGMFVLTSSSGQDVNPETISLQPECHMPFVEADTPKQISTSDGRMVYSEADHGGCCSAEVINHIDSLLHNSSRLQIPENGAFALQSCDILGSSFPQSVSFSMQLPAADGQLMFNTDPNQYSNSHADQEPIPPSALEDFIYPKEFDCLQCEDNSVEAKETSKLLSVNDFGLTSSNDPEHCPLADKDTEIEEQKDSGTLFYEPPRFPSVDKFPFFSCDLIQSGSDTHQEFSPLGIRQLMISPMAPHNLWDSPTRDDTPDAILKNAAKTFTGTPSILKKRHRDLLTPLSEKRDEKKLDGCRKQEVYSNLNDLSRLEFMFDDCIDKTGQLVSHSPNRRNFDESCMEKENTTPASGHERDEGKKCIVLTDREMTAEGSNNNGNNCSNKTTEKIAPTDVRTGQLVSHSPNRRNFDASCMEKENTTPAAGHERDEGRKCIVLTDREMTAEGSNNNGNNCSNKTTEKIVHTDVRTKSVEDSTESANEYSGVLVERNVNDPLLFSPDRFITKNDRTVGPSARTYVKQYSRRLNTVSKQGASLTSLQSTSPSAKNVESSGKGLANENNNNIFVETPFKRSLESPSAWKSPWFMNSFAPGPRVNTDITIEDIGYYSPGEGSYDALGLMKQLGEQTAGTFSDAQKVLGDETPDTILKGENATNHDEENDLSQNPSSSFTNERRMLDFSECVTPGKESARLSSSPSLSSPSSYLLKNCR